MTLTLDLLPSGEAINQSIWTGVNSGSRVGRSQTNQSINDTELKELEEQFDVHILNFEPCAYDVLSCFRQLQV